jgi:hypothetical protein
MFFLINIALSLFYLQKSIIFKKEFPTVFLNDGQSFVASLKKILSKNVVLEVVVKKNVILEDFVNKDAVQEFVLSLSGKGEVEVQCND